MQVNKAKLNFEKAREMQVIETQIMVYPLIWIRKLEVKLKEVNFAKKEKSKRETDVYKSQNKQTTKKTSAENNQPELENSGSQIFQELKLGENKIRKRNWLVSKASR